MSKNSFVYALGNAANSSVGFVLIPFFTNNLSSTQYGFYAAIEIWLNVTLVLFTAGFGVSVFSIWPKLKGTVKKEFTTACIVVYPLLVVFLELLAFIALIKFFDYKDTYLALAFLMLVFLEVIWIVTTSLDRAENRLIKFTLCSLLKLGITLASTIYLVKQLNYGGIGILYGRLFGVLIIVPIIFSFYDQLRANNLIYHLRCIFRVSIPLIPAALIVVGCAMLPRLYIESAHGTEALGTFAMSSKIAGVVLLVFVQPLSMAWMVAVYKISNNIQAKEIFSQFLNLVVWASFLFLGTIFIFSDTTLAHFETESFELSTSVFLFSCAANFITAITYAVNLGPYVQRKTEAVLPSYFFFLSVNMLLGYFLIKYFSLAGAGLSIFIANVALMLLLNRQSQKMYPVNYDLKMLIIYAAIGLAAVTIGEYQAQTFGSLLVILFLFIAWMLFVAKKLALFEVFNEIHPHG